MGALHDVLTFRKMVSPAILQVLFWAAIGGCLYGTWVLIQLGNTLWFMPLIFGPLLTRVIFERALIAFRSYDRQCELVELYKQQ